MRSVFKPGSPGRGDFRLVRQTHASFVDSLFLKAHLDHLDREHEALRLQRSTQVPGLEPGELSVESVLPTDSQYASYGMPGGARHTAGGGPWAASHRSAGSAIKMEEMPATTVTSARGAGSSRGGVGQSRGGSRWKGAGVEAAKDDNPRFLIDGTPAAGRPGSGRASADLACVAGGGGGGGTVARGSGTGGHIFSNEFSSRTQPKPGYRASPHMRDAQKRPVNASWGAREAFGPDLVRPLAGQRQGGYPAGETAHAAASARRATQGQQTEGLRAGSRSIHLQARQRTPERDALTLTPASARPSGRPAGGSGALSPLPGQGGHDEDVAPAFGLSGLPSYPPSRGPGQADAAGDELGDAVEDGDRDGDALGGRRGPVAPTTLPLAPDGPATPGRPDPEGSGGHGPRGTPGRRASPRQDLAVDITVQARGGARNAQAVGGPTTLTMPAAGRSSHQVRVATEPGSQRTASRPDTRGRSLRDTDSCRQADDRASKAESTLHSVVADDDNAHAAEANQEASTVRGYSALRDNPLTEGLTEQEVMDIRQAAEMVYPSLTQQSTSRPDRTAGHFLSDGGSLRGSLATTAPREIYSSPRGTASPFRLAGQAPNRLDKISTAGPSPRLITGGQQTTRPRHAQSQSRSHSRSRGSYDAGDGAADLRGLHLDSLGAVTEMLGLRLLRVLPQEQFMFGGTGRYAPGVIGQKKQLASRSRGTRRTRKLTTDGRVDGSTEVHERSSGPCLRYGRPCATAATGHRAQGEVYYVPALRGGRVPLLEVLPTAEFAPLAQTSGRGAGPAAPDGAAATLGSPGQARVPGQMEAPLPRDAALYPHQQRPLPPQLAQVGLALGGKRPGTGAGSDYHASEESIAAATPQLGPTFGLAARANAPRINVQNSQGYSPTAIRTRTIEFAPSPSELSSQQAVSPTVWRPKLLPIEERSAARAFRVRPVGPGSGLHPIPDVGDAPSTILGRQEARPQFVDKDRLQQQIEQSNARSPAEKPQSQRAKDRRLVGHPHPPSATAVATALNSAMTTTLVRKEEPGHGGTVFSDRKKGSAALPEGEHSPRVPGGDSVHTHYLKRGSGDHRNTREAGPADPARSALTLKQDIRPGCGPHPPAALIDAGAPRTPSSARRRAEKEHPVVRAQAGFQLRLRAHPGPKAEEGERSRLLNPSPSQGASPGGRGGSPASGPRGSRLKKDQQVQSSPALEPGPPSLGARDGSTDRASSSKADDNGKQDGTHEAAAGGDAPLLLGALPPEGSPRQGPKPRLVDMLEGEKQFLMHTNVGEPGGPVPDKLLVNMRVIAGYERREADRLELCQRLEVGHQRSADVAALDASRLSFSNGAQGTGFLTDRAHCAARGTITAAPSGLGSSGQASLPVAPLRAFAHRQGGAPGAHYYNQPECSYVMLASRERRTQAMIKDYGLIAANSNRQAPFFEDKDDHRLRLKRVPFRQAVALGMHVNLSDIASPRESKHTHWLLRQREKNKQVADVQHRQQEQQLARHFSVSSPATQLSRAIKIDERTKNARAKPLMKQNPMLYTDFEAMKTWNISQDTGLQ